MTEQPLALRLADELKRGGMSLDNIPIIEAELRRLHECLEQALSQNTELDRKCAEYEAEAEALKADAERYRWLRRDVTSLRDINEMNHIVTDFCEEQMDAAIDAARGQHGS